MGKVQDEGPLWYGLALALLPTWSVASVPQSASTSGAGRATRSDRNVQFQVRILLDGTMEEDDDSTCDDDEDDAEVLAPDDDDDDDDGP